MTGCDEAANGLFACLSRRNAHTYCRSNRGRYLRKGCTGVSIAALRDGPADLLCHKWTPHVRTPVALWRSAARSPPS